MWHWKRVFPEFLLFFSVKIIPPVLHTDPVWASTNGRQENGHFQRHNSIFLSQGEMGLREKTALFGAMWLFVNGGRKGDWFGLHFLTALINLSSPTDSSPYTIQPCTWKQHILLQGYTLSQSIRLQSEEPLLWKHRNRNGDYNAMHRSVWGMGK